MFKTKRTQNNTARDFVICFCLSSGVILVLSLICALIASSLSDPTANLGLFSLGAMILSAIVSGIFSVKYRKDCSIGYAALVALMVVLIMLLINVIISGGKISLGAFMNYGCYIGTYLLGALIAKHTGGRRKHR